VIGGAAVRDRNPDLIASLYRLLRRGLLAGRAGGRSGRSCAKTRKPMPGFHLGSDPTQAQTSVSDGPDGGDRRLLRRNWDQLGFLASALDGVAERLAAPNPS
jgi:hypothetical protein